MNRAVILAIALVTSYLVWLLVFLLLIEPWLRNLTGKIFGFTISRELNRLTGPSSNISLLDILDAYRWKLNGPASLSIRFGVGLLRISFWLVAVVAPLVLAIFVFLGLRSQ